MDTIFLCISDGWITAISTALLTIFTGALAYLTFRIARYTKGTFEESKISYRKSINEITKDRIIGIIYNQLDRIENAIEKFEIVDGKSTIHIGYKALLYFKHTVARSYPITDEGKSAEEIFIARKQINKHNLELLIPNDDQINILSIRLYNAIGIVKETLLHRELDIEEINRLKKLLFDNIGFINIEVIKEISKSIDEYYKIFTEDENYVIDTGHLNLAMIFFRSILKFEDVIFTTENFESTKKELLK